MTSLISNAFATLKDHHQKALIPFLTADFPNRSIFNRLLHALPSHGATMIEIGIPFSDPMADGPVIQKTSKQAIDNEFSLNNCFSDVLQFKSAHPTIPIVFMTYCNPILQYGAETFMNDCSTHGVDGVLVVDLPPDHEASLFNSQPAFDMIRLVTPTTNIDRLSTIATTSRGFLYYVSVKGITGTQTPDARIVGNHLDLIRSNINLPMVIGFGISSVSVAKEMADISDGVVIGSALLSPFVDATPSTYEDIMAQQLHFIGDISSQINNA